MVCGFAHVTSITDIAGYFDRDNWPLCQTQSWLILISPSVFPLCLESMNNDYIYDMGFPKNQNGSAANN